MTNSDTLFSVLMANYNNGHFIEKAVHSVKAQSYSNWELVIIDDASTDNSWDIITRIVKSDARLKASRNKRNRKVGATKRKCVAIASGEICGILDSDDCLTTDALATMVECHNEHPECSLISSKHYICDEALHVARISDVQKPIKPGMSYLESTPGIVHSFWTFKKRYYDKTKGFSSLFILAEDQDLFYKLEEVGKLHFLDQPLYYYRIHGNGISTNDNLALAYSWHIQAMVEALSRRSESEEKLAYKREAVVVACNISRFLSWGIRNLNSRRLYKHIIDLIRLQPRYIVKRPVIRTIAWLLKLKWSFS